MSEPSDASTALDGNAAAGVLSSVFTTELTAAVAWCAGCGRGGALAEATYFVDAPGAVLRCPGCEGVLVRVVVAPERTWLDLHGVSVIELRSGT